MKKALSILLIIAAVFGFYGGAVNIKDVLACKDYWEVEGEKSTENLNKLEDGINQLEENEEAYLDGLDQVAQGEQDLAKGEADYASGQKTYNSGVAALASLNNVNKNINAVNTEYNKWLNNFGNLKSKIVTLNPNGEPTSGVLYDLGAAKLAIDGVCQRIQDIPLFEDDKEALGTDAAKIGGVVQNISSPYNDYKMTALGLSHVDDMVRNASRDMETLIGKFEDMSADASALKDALNYVKHAEESTSSWIKGYGTLAKGQDKVANKISKALKSIVSDSNVTAGIRKKNGSQAVELLKSMQDAKNFKNNPTKTPVEYLYAVMEGVEPSPVSLKDTLAQIQGSVKDGIAKNTPVLSKGKADLQAGAVKLAQGRQDLADGKAKLAEYEDGEQQVRDGLATLFATEANGGLDSIASRLNNDGNFDNEDGHLMLDRGLTGVQEGRNYSDDSSVVITKELTTRAIGTGAGLGAALLALIGAILCFAKKYKGAGVFAALTAICGVAGIAVAKSAGTEFSGIAGSPLSATPYIAFAVLAGLGVIAAIANFAAKKA